MKQTTISRWADFERFIRDREGWAFRGQENASWPLVSSLTRRLVAFQVAPREWLEREERAIRIFRRKAHVYLPDRSVLNDTLRCLAMMQHHGAPTRLLDFTKSPFVAAFFALERATADSVVFALNTPALWKARPRFNPSLLRDHIDPRIDDNFTRYFAEGTQPVLWFGEPSELDRRLIAQSGLLVVPGVLSQNLDEILMGYEEDEPLLEQVIIPATLRSHAMHELYRMNITQATLFPDLEGLARSIAYELEESWPATGRTLS